MISSCISSASNYGYENHKIIKDFDSFEGPPFRVADILVQPCLIDAYNVSVFGVHQVLKAMEVTHGLPVCCAVFAITFKLLAFITRQLILPAFEAETGPGLGLMSPDIKRPKVASELL